MEKGIYGLAFLQYSYEHSHHDIIDAYIPLICHCLSVMQADKAEVLPVRKQLDIEYGLSNITDGAVISIFGRMAKDSYGYLSLNDGIYLVNKQKVEEGIKKPKEDLIAGYDEIVTKIENYAKCFNVSFSRDEIEKGLFHFMDLYDVELTLGNIHELCQQLTKYKSNEKQIKYIISKYLIDAIDKDKDAVSMMVKLAKGHALSSIVCLQNLNNMSGSLKNVSIYLDAPIIFNLLNLNDAANYHLATELMQILKKNGVHFCIFDHNHNEVINTMTDARDRLQTGNYDLRKSSRLLKMAHREGLSSMHINHKINEFADLLESWQVEIKSRPSLQEGAKDIDVVLLSDIIKDVYTNKGTRSLFVHELNMLETDIDSITYIYRLRGNVACTSLKNSKAILLSTNRVISTASHDKRINFLNHAIPACSTDVFLSTILWTNYPSSNDDLNQKLLMSECYNGIELDDQLMLKFYEQIAAQRNNGVISEQQYLQATSSRMALDILADKTLNDINAYTDRTTSEVLEIIEHAHKEELRELEQKKDKELEEAMAAASLIHENDEKTIDELQGKLDTHDENIRQTADTIAKWITLGIFVLLVVVFYLIKFYPKPESSPWYIIAAYYLAWVLVGFWGILSWGSIIPPKVKLHRWISDWLYEKMSDRINDDY